MFFGRLEGFLGSLPKGWRYAVEIRNKDYLGSDYFALLSRHNVAHVFNAWTRMPTLAEQIALDGAFTADFSVTRALLQRGRTYEQAVKLFEPYEKIQEPDHSTRDALKQIAERALKKKQRAYAFVNNRLEGNAPQTIKAVVDAIGTRLSWKATRHKSPLATSIHFGNQSLPTLHISVNKSYQFMNEH